MGVKKCHVICVAVLVGDSCWDAADVDVNKIGDSVEPCGKPFLSMRSRLICPVLVLSLKLRFDKMFMMKRTRWRSGMVRRSVRARPWCQTVS